MEIDKLVCFCAAYETRSFAKAAEQSYLSRQAISKNIKAIEQEWGVVLFDRTREGVVPTEVAATLFPLAKRIIELYDEIAEIARGRSAKKALRISAANGVISSLGQEVFAEFKETYPSIEIDLSIEKEEDCKRMILDGRRDVALIVGSVMSNEVKSVFLKKERLYLVGLSSLLDKSGELPVGTKLNLLDRSFFLDASLLEDGYISSEDFDVQYHGDNYDKVIELVKIGDGACIAPSQYLEAFGKSDIFARIFDDRFTWEIYLAIRKAAMNDPAVTLFVHFVLDRMNEQQHGGEKGGRKA